MKILYIEDPDIRIPKCFKKSKRKFRRKIRRFNIEQLIAITYLPLESYTASADIIVVWYRTLKCYAIVKNYLEDVMPLQTFKNKEEIKDYVFALKL